MYIYNNNNKYFLIKQVIKNYNILINLKKIKIFKRNVKLNRTDRDEHKTFAYLYCFILSYLI